MEPGDEGGRQDVNTATIIRKKKGIKIEEMKRVNAENSNRIVFHLYTLSLKSFTESTILHKPLPYLMFIAIQC